MTAGQVTGVTPASSLARRGVPVHSDVDEVAARHGLRLTQGTSALLVLVVGSWYPVLGGLTAGTVLVLALLPVVVPAALRFRGAGLLLTVGALALANGLALASLAQVDHAVIRSVTRDAALHVVGIVVGVAAVLWARTVWRDAWVALFFGVGMLVDAVLGPTGTNAWKFAYGLPVTVVVLAVAWLTRRWLVELGALVLLAGVCAVQDSRSMFGLLLMAATLVLWQALRRRSRRRMSARSLVVMLAVLGAGVYQLGKALALEGALGAAAAERSALQIEQSGSLLVGSRPEMGASFALVEARPWGFGFGVVPNGLDLRAAKGGMAQLGYDPDNGYVHRYMFGRGIELHSVLGDLWAWMGLAGAVLAIVMTVLLVRGLVTGLAGGVASGLVVALTLRCLWDMFFAPVYSSMSIFTLALGLALPLVAARVRRAPVKPRRAALSGSRVAPRT